MRVTEGRLIPTGIIISAALTGGTLFLRPPSHDQTIQSFGTTSQEQTIPKSSMEHTVYYLAAADLSMKSIEAISLPLEQELAQKALELSANKPDMLDYQLFGTKFPEGIAGNNVETAFVRLQEHIDLMKISDNLLFQQAADVISNALIEKRLQISPPIVGGWHVAPLKITPIVEKDHIRNRMKITSDIILDQPNRFSIAFLVIKLAVLLDSADRYMATAQLGALSETNDYLNTFLKNRSEFPKDITGLWENKATEAQRQAFRVYAPLSIREMIER